jgi:hypothetical protein
VVCRSCVSRLTPSAIESLLRFVAFGFLIAFPTASIAAFLFPPRPTVERTPQILPPAVARIGEKPDLTLATADDAALQIGSSPDRLIERGLIQFYKRNNPFVLMPILLRREKLLESEDKNTRFSVMMRIVFVISSC